MSRLFKPALISISVAVLWIVGLWLIGGALRDRSAAAKAIGFSSGPVAVQSPPLFTIALQKISGNLAYPTQVTHAADDSGRLFVVERAGDIRVITNGLVLTPFLDIRSTVESTGSWERGLLSVAFDPDYKTNGTFYVDYTTNVSGHVGDIIVARYVVSEPLANAAQVLTVTNLLTIPHPEVTHHGGQLQFNPVNGYLYVSTGDGGGSGDRHGVIGNAQDLSMLLGKILRINVRGVPTYTIPPSNPFTKTIGARPEIWAYGLRNPWRFAFDRSTGDLYLGDVGQDCFEEIDYQPSGSHGGENYGWRLMEGNHYFVRTVGGCAQPVVPPTVWITLTRPITSYYHGDNESNGEAVVGGYVYRGAQYPWLKGVYFFADFASGRIWTQQSAGPQAWTSSHLLDSGLYISSWGEDQSGELYVTDYYGAVYRLVSWPVNLSASSLQASKRAARQGEVVTFSLVLRNSGNSITGTLLVTNTVPISLSYLTGSFTATSGDADESDKPNLVWEGDLSNTSSVTLTYAVVVAVPDSQMVVNTATIDPETFAPSFTRSASLLINGLQFYLPFVFKTY